MSRVLDYRRAICPEGMSYCSKCQKYDVNDNFPNATKGPNGKNWWCKQCVKNHQASRSNILTLYNKRKNYGISEKEYLNLWNQQGGVCAVCGNPETKVYKGRAGILTVDHNHQTGKVRGLLCSACNAGLGCFRDDIYLLEKAANYLRDKDGERTQNPRPVTNTNEVKRVNEITSEVMGLPKTIRGQLQDVDGLPLFDRVPI